jgi:lipoprotein-anchoring transpeptidase ErfK/SrfK
MSGNNTKEDWILTRILWLSGLEIGFNRLGNQDTMQRFIYIHGTNDLSRLGKPVSHGCIRMDNQDIIDLFEEINIGDHVLINEI